MQTSEAATLAVIAFFIATMSILHTPQNAPQQPTVVTSVPAQQQEVSVEGAVEPAPAKTFAAKATTTARAMVAAAGGTLPKKTSPATSTVTTTSDAAMIVERPKNLYLEAPQSVDAINQFSRSVVVNIFCTSNNGTFGPVTGSGVLLSSDGIILTNAHVAQYVFLSQAGMVDMTCSARNGSPATTLGTLGISYLPLPWVKKNASQIRRAHPVGTGQNDFALVSLISPPQSRLPYIAPDIREKAAFQDDQVLVASYPAEFLGSMVTQSDLYAVSSVTRVTQMLTFDGSSVDAFALGSVIGAQGGSSGGAVVNGWNRLVGLITTTSAGDTTADRELHAISPFHINQAIKAETGHSLADWAANGREYGRSFITSSAAPIIDIYGKAIQSSQN